MTLYDRDRDSRGPSTPSSLSAAADRSACAQDDSAGALFVDECNGLAEGIDYPGTSNVATKLCAQDSKLKTRRFTKVREKADNNKSKQESENRMVATGELIRMMNYIDDIAATLRRVQVGITTMTDEEKKRLADYMKNSDPNFIKILEGLEKHQ